MKLFRPGLSPHHTALAMIGVKPAMAVLVVGAAEPALAAELALITGLNGRTVVASASPDEATTVQAAAEKAGALLEFAPLTAQRAPFDADTFDVVVLQRQMQADHDAAGAIVREAVRVTRAGGRVIAIEAEARAGLLAAMRRRPEPRLGGEAMASRLTQAQLIAVRVLADTNGVIYVEGRKK